MREFIYDTELWLPRPTEAVFNFFADAANLQAITPGWLDFKILTPAPIILRTGALIDYKLRVHGLPVRWQTEITAWQPPASLLGRTEARALPPVDSRTYLFPA